LNICYCFTITTTKINTHSLHDALPSYGRTRRHSRSNSDNLVICTREFYQRQAEYILVLRRLGSCTGLLMNLARDLVEFSGCVPCRCIAFFSGSVTFAFYGNTMKYLGTFYVFQVVENRHQVIDIVSVNGTEVPEVERLEEVAFLKQC